MNGLFKGDTVRVDDHEIFVLHDARAEARNRPCILFLHGFPDSLETWSEQMDALKDDFRVAAMDLRGTNRSSGPRDARAYHIPAMFADLVAVIAFLGGPVHLVTHDWGALIGWCFAADQRHAQTLLSFTALSCPHPAAAKTEFLNKLLRRGWSGFKQALDQIRRSWYILFIQVPLLPAIAMRLLGGPIWAYMSRAGELAPDDPLREYSPARRRKIVAEFMPYYRGLLRGPSLALEQPITLPCRLIVPLRDLAIVPAIYDGMPAYAKSLEIIPLDTNHWPHRELPAETTRLIREFIYPSSSVFSSSPVR